MNKNQKEKLWEEYTKYRTSSAREKLILEYIELVKIISGRLSMYLGNNVEYDDLIGYGSLGLIDAIDKFDYNKGVKFETYASFRIRGAIIDEIRKLDWVPRTVRKKQKDLKNAISKIELQAGRKATEEDLVKELGVSSDELNDLRSQIELSSISSLDEYMETGTVHLSSIESNQEFTSPEKNIETQELKESLANIIDTLTKREREVITLYYYEELTLKEISYILDITESRVSQLHRRALEKMKEKLGAQIEGLFVRNI